MANGDLLVAEDDLLVEKEALLDGQKNLLVAEDDLPMRGKRAQVQKKICTWLKKFC